MLLIINDLFYLLIKNYKYNKIIFLIEIIAVLSGIISIILSQKANSNTYIVGILSTSIYIYLTFIYSLYGDMLVNIYYNIMNFYGFYIWKIKKINKKDIDITFSTKFDYYINIVIFIFSIFFITIFVFILNIKIDYINMINIVNTGFFL